MSARRQLASCLALLGALGAALLLTPLNGQAANAVSFRVLDTSNVEDPVEDVARTFVFEGTADAPTRIYVKYRAAGGAPCAPSAFSDSGVAIDPYDDAVNGNFRIAYAETWRTSGSYLFCMWLAPTSSTVAPSFSRTVTFRNPNGSVSIAAAPVVFLPRVAGTLTVSGVSEAPRRLYVKYRASGGAPCAPSPFADSGQGIDPYDVAVNGAFSIKELRSFDRPASLVLCAWLREGSSDIEPVGTTPSAFNLLVRAPPPCVVPSLRGRTIKAAVAALRRANCGVGKIIRVYSSAVRRGRILRSSPKAGARHVNGRLVHLIVSRGPR